MSELAKRIEIVAHGGIVQGQERKGQPHRTAAAPDPREPAAPGRREDTRPGRHLGRATGVGRMNDLPTRRAFNRAGAAALDKQIDDALAQQKAERDAAYAAARASGAAHKAQQGSVTHNDLVKAGADTINDTGKGVLVRDLTGWHRVVKLNKVTVLVPGPWGGTRAVRIDRLLEVWA